MVAVSWCAGLDTDYHAAVWVTEPCLGPVLEDRPWLHVKKSFESIHRTPVEKKLLLQRVTMARLRQSKLILGLPVITSATKFLKNVLAAAKFYNSCRTFFSEIEHVGI